MQCEGSLEVLQLKPVDREILSILRRTYLEKGVRPMLSDEHARIWIVRMFTVCVFVSVIARIVLEFRVAEVSAQTAAVLATPVALFFGILFLHINNESESSSLLVLLLTWLSIVAGLYI